MMILPIAIAVLVAVYLVTHKPGPHQKPIQESIKPLRVVKTSSVDLIPTVAGYGTARPGSVWEAVAEVKGTVRYIHSRLKAGEIIPAETVLIKLDGTEYQLAISRTAANVAKTQAEIRELAIAEDNARKMIAVEKQSLILARDSIERKRKLLKHNAASKDDVDQEEISFLQQQQNLLKLENDLALIPSKKESLQAVLEVYRSDLRQAQINLSKTVIRAPYDCRPGDVNIKAGQFIQAGQLLFQAHGTDVTEIDVQFRIEDLQKLLNEQMRNRLQPGLGTGDFGRLFKDVRGVVELQSGEWSAQWDARIDRFREAVAVKTREIMVVVAVDHPYEKVIPGERPPLMAGMFCRVELQGPVQPRRMVVPRSAVHDDVVFIVDSESRLQKKQVIVDFFQSEAAVLRSGVSIGDRVVVSDPAPAMIGMKISPVVDDGFYRRMTAVHRGKEARQ